MKVIIEDMNGEEKKTLHFGFTRHTPEETTYAHYHERMDVIESHINRIAYKAKEIKE